MGSGRCAGHESQALISGIGTQAKGARCHLAFFFSTEREVGRHLFSWRQEVGHLQPKRGPHQALVMPVPISGVSHPEHSPGVYTCPQNGAKSNSRPGML